MATRKRKPNVTRPSFNDPTKAYTPPAEETDSPPKDPATSGGEITIDAAGETWEVLAANVERFLEAWEAEDEPPNLAAFLPAEPAVLRELTLVELIKVDLEYRWKHGRDPKKVEDYARQFATDFSGPPPSDLIYEEYHVRRQNGETVPPQEFFDRFPERADELRRLLDIESPSVTTSLAPAAVQHDLQAGGQVDDFDLLLPLGSGSFASVYLARQRTMQRLVALKVSADKGEEAQTLAQLEHHYIVRVYDQRRLPERKQRLIYMQYVPGGTLLDVIKDIRGVDIADRSGRSYLQSINRSLAEKGEDSPTDSARRRELAAADWPQLVCRVGAWLAQALAYAHDRGVLHRDVKPANVLLAADGSPKLADFNISFASNLDGASPAAFFGGSLAYMSPEQLDACNPAHDRQPDELDGRSDLYSLGVMLWELLEGERPFRDETVGSAWSETLAKMSHRRRSGPPPAARAPHASACHAELREVLRRCLAADPDDRYANGHELARRLLLCLQPQVTNLMRPARRGWRRWARWSVVASIWLAVLVPNALAGWFNYAYNRQEIIDHLQGAFPSFWNTQMAVNGIAFPLGGAVLIAMAWPIILALQARRRGKPPDEELRRRARRRCARLGHYAALLSLGEWLIAGIAYPVSIQLLVPGAPPHMYLHFASSLAVCGLIAAAYPFFFVTLITMRAYYPTFLGDRDHGEEESAELKRLSRRSAIYLQLAGGVPMLAVTLLVLMGSQNQFALAVLSTAGLIGFAISFAMYRVLQRDLATLTWAVQPLDSIRTDSISESTL